MTDWTLETVVAQKTRVEEKASFWRNRETGESVVRVLEEVGVQTKFGRALRVGCLYVPI